MVFDLEWKRGGFRLPVGHLQSQKVIDGEPGRTFSPAGDHEIHLHGALQGRLETGIFKDEFID